MTIFAKFQEPTPSRTPTRFQSGRSRMDKLSRNDELWSIPSLLSALKVCSRSRDLEHGRRIHRRISGDSSASSNTYVLNSLVSMYAKCGSMADARELFDSIPNKTIVSWNSIILGYAENGDSKQALDLFSEMELNPSSDRPNRVTYLAALKACANLALKEQAKRSTSIQCLETGRRIHSRLAEVGLEQHCFVASTLIDMYGKCGSMVDARSIFDRMQPSDRDVVCWSSMIRGYADAGRGDVALDLLELMQADGVCPNAVTYLAALKASASFGNPSKLHSMVLRSGSEEDGFVANALVDLYGKRGRMIQAQLVFDGIASSSEDVAPWNAVILGYAEGGEEARALELFETIQQLGRSNPVTYLAALKACVNLAGKSPSSSPRSSPRSSTGSPEALRLGRGIHSCLKQSGHDRHLFVANTLIDLYGKCGCVDQAKEVFDSIQQRDVLIWTAMIAAFAEGGQNEQALELFTGMESEHRDQEHCRPNQVTYLAVLKASTNLGALATGRSIHARVSREGFDEELLVTTALIDFYGRSGSCGNAEAVFHAAVASRDVGMWNALLAARSHAGESDLVLDGFRALRDDDCLKPNEITFVSVLAACGHAGLVDAGRKFFREMQGIYGIDPSEEHLSCVVDLLCRANRCEEAKELLSQQMPRPGFVTLMAALGGCRKWGNVAVAKFVFDRILELDISEEDRSAAAVLMSGI